MAEHLGDGLAGRLDGLRGRQRLLRDPYDIGYGGIVAFDHDFVGRQALEEIAQNPAAPRSPWCGTRGRRSGHRVPLRTGGPAGQVHRVPKARYALHQSDKVLVDGQLVGISMDVGYIANERAMVSLATVDLAHSEPGTEVTVVWARTPTRPSPASNRTARRGSARRWPRHRTCGSPGAPTATGRPVSPAGR
ncbi:hypothetical protein NKH77_55520 [Streptomyces sp. M19]